MQYVKPIFEGIMLNVTDDCNLRCKYCFVNKSPNYMSFQVAKDTIDLLISINKPKNKIPSITFFGGEPTLCWDSIIVPLVEYTKQINEKVDFQITTNGILLDEEKLKYTIDNNIGILLSIDGIKECQDINRPFPNGEGSFDVLNKKLPLIVKYHPNTTFRSTLYPDTCYTLFDNIKYAADNNFKAIFTVPDEGSIWSEEHKKILEVELTKYTDYYINSILSKKSFIDLTPISNMFKTIVNTQEDLNNNNDCNLCSFPTCGLGIDFVSVNYEGKIFACQELPSNNELNIKYLIGDIYNGIDKDKHDKLIESYKNSKLSCINLDMCTDCKIKPMCSKLVCHANSYIYNKNMSKKTEIKCFWDNLLFKEASKIISVLDSNEDFIKIFLQGILYGK